jgi:hypothetical protein
MIPPSSRRAAAFAGLVLSFLGSGAFAQNQTSTFSPVVIDGSLPYQLSLGVYNMGGSAIVPTLQSYALGVSNNLWVIVAGRTNGLHNFTADGFQNFPPAYQNTVVWVIDPVNKQTWSRALDDPTSGLTVQQVDALSATNTESVQVGDRLYIAGGYVYDRTADDFTTFSTLTALDLAGVVDWVQGGVGTLATHLRQTSDPTLKVAGGELRMINGRALLVLGQDFEGPYTVASNGNYTQQVRTFDIVDDGVTLSIANISASAPLPEYRRRDLNVVPFLKDGGATEGLLALAGVFLPGVTGGAWTVPVEIGADGTPSMADPNLTSTFKQGMSTYRSATISLYSANRNETHTISLGGISLEYYDASTGQIAYDPEVPFINGITDIVRTDAGAYTQYYLGEFPTIPNPSNGNAPFLFGAEANFIPSPVIPAYDNGMLNLDSLTQPTVIGYIFGGIIAAQANYGATGASNYIFTVTYSPVTAPAPTPAPAAPSFQTSGKSSKHTDKTSLVLKGTANSSTAVIEWKLGNRKNFKTQAVATDGSWQIRVHNLVEGKNPVRLRGVSTGGQRTQGRTVTIIRN